jgi:hypothetical protein
VALGKSVTGNAPGELPPLMACPLAGPRQARPHGDSNPSRRLEKPDTQFGTHVGVDTYRETVASATYSATSYPSNPPDDADLRLIVAAWLSLPAAVRAGIVALVRASTAASGAEQPSRTAEGGGR